MPSTLMRPSAEYRPRRDYGETDWPAALGAGLIAGIAFVALQPLLVWRFADHSPWEPLRATAAIVLGPELLTQPAELSMIVLALALAVHVPLSLVYGAAIGWLVHRLAPAPALLAGLALGLAIYALNFYLLAPAAFAWFVDSLGWITALTHVVFGVVAAGAYVAMRRPPGHEPRG